MSSEAESMVGWVVLRPCAFYPSNRGSRGSFAEIQRWIAALAAVVDDGRPDVAECFDRVGTAKPA